MFVVSCQAKDYDWTPHHLLYAGENQEKALEIYRQPVEKLDDYIYTLSVFNSGELVNSFEREVDYKATPMSLEELKIQRSYITPGSTGCYPEHNYEPYIKDNSYEYFTGVGKPI